MKAAEALIAWGPGRIAVGPLLQDGEGDWARPYQATGGAAYASRRGLLTLSSDRY